MTRRTLAAAAMFLLLVSAPARSTAATLEGGTLAAWNVYVAATEARIASELRASRGFLTTDFGERGESVRKTVKEGGIDVSAQRTRNRQGSAIAVPDGLISHWRGSVFLPGARLASLLDRVQHPSETGPHQEDVLALRVLDRGDNWLKLYIRMTRTKIVTVTYDTEHQVSYRRHSPDHVSSQSIATKIAEIEGAGTARESAKPQGQDRGFLWRMNSYWRYEQVPGGVIVELESLTLSRSIPLGLGVVVQPIIDNIAEESMTRTLDNLRTSYTSSSRTLAAVRQ